MRQKRYDFARPLADLRARALREPRRRRVGRLYYHGTGLARDASIRRHGICAIEPGHGPSLGEDPVLALLLGARDLWRTEGDDERCIVYAVRAPRSAVRPKRHGPGRELDWWVPSGRVPPSWIVAHKIICVPNFPEAATEAHIQGITAAFLENQSDCPVQFYDASSASPSDQIRALVA